jgi:hypothetical protein
VLELSPAGVGNIKLLPELPAYLDVEETPQLLPILFFLQVREQRARKRKHIPIDTQWGSCDWNIQALSDPKNPGPLSDVSDKSV